MPVSRIRDSAPDSEPESQPELAATLGPERFRREIETAGDPAQRQTELVDEYEERFANPYQAAERGYVDDVIEPHETRPKLIAVRSVTCT